MRPTFELRYREGRAGDAAPSTKRCCEPGQLMAEARRIFDASDTPVIEAWLYDRYMFALDRSVLAGEVERRTQ